MSEDVFLYEEVPGSSRLVIMFSAASAKRFTGYKMLQTAQVSRLFVRDPTRSWYNGPVTGWWDNADGLLERLRSVTQRFDPANIVCMGGSMGGYAAILFGSLLGGGKVLAISPQMVLDSRLPNNPAPHHDILYPNVYAAIAQAESTAIDIFIGSEDICDIYNMMAAKKYSQIRLSNVYGAEHNVMHWLMVHGVLQRFMIEYALCGSTDISLPLCSLHEDEDIMHLVKNAVEAYYFHSPATAVVPLETLVQRVPHWSAAHCWLGMARTRNNDDAGAAEALRQATSRATQSSRAWFELSIVLTKLKNYQEAESAILRALQLAPNPPHAAYYTRLGIICMFKKEYSRAREAQNKALQINPKYDDALYQLGLISSMQGDHAQAAQQFEKALALGSSRTTLKKHLVTALYHAAPENFDHARARALCPDHPLLAARHAASKGLTDETLRQLLADES